MEPSDYDDGGESSVDEGAFWHTNMDLFYGHLIGEIVEVEHEQNKYWLASIEYCYKHLMLLKWLGNYSEFWIDTSLTTATVSANSAFDSVPKTPKRIFPLGFHQQSQLKSQYQLDKPSNFLVKPTLYDPSRDPYANIKSVEDLLDHTAEQPSDTFDISQTSTSGLEPANFALAKCQTEIDYGQEDVDELEAALNNLIGEHNGTENVEPAAIAPTSGQDDSPNLNHTNIEPSGNTTRVDSSRVVVPETNLSSPNRDSFENDKDEDLVCLELCKYLQDLALKEGYYFGVNPDGKSQSRQIFYTKPKLIFDVGGANHERVFVPGTLVSVEWTAKNGVARKLCNTKSDRCKELYWFAFVVKNIGGRLILRWFLCDEPKFKQGRLELKSSRSKFVIEDDDQVENDNSTKNRTDDMEAPTASYHEQCAINSRDLTMALHFCDPRIHTIDCPADLFNDRRSRYLLPDVITNHLERSLKPDQIDVLANKQLEHIFDQRRMKLDKDRPLIDHILKTVQTRAPNYLDLIIPFNKSKGELLISSSRMTKLVRGKAEKFIRHGVYEIRSSEKIDNEEELNFIYPFESAYAVLPLEWADNNQDCLSIEPSRNSSPNQNLGELKVKKEEDLHDRITNDNSITKMEESADCTQPLSSSLEPEGVERSVRDTIEEMLRDDDLIHPGKSHNLPINEEFCLKSFIADIPRAGGSFVHPKDGCYGYVESVYDPNSWLQSIELQNELAQKFHCCLDSRMKSQVENQFKVMSMLEVVHPLSDSTICLGRIRKVVFPLLWIQISADCYTVLPFNSTNIYPVKWCERHEHPLISLLPPRKRAFNHVQSQQQNDGSKKRKKTKLISNNGNEQKSNGVRFNDQTLMYEKEHFNLNAINSRQIDLDYMLHESNDIKIYFNHKCFTGPSLSKSKICSLPQYVGPGPLHLVLEEVVTKIISVAYVPPRILNDLSSASFKQLLIDHGLTNTHDLGFKAKYQKRVHRDRVPVCVNTEDVALYCETLCEHIKCCYNLFGLKLYDGDDCPGHCRALTKSNKFMKRATYYRDKARAGEFINLNNNNTASEQQTAKKVNSANAADNLLKASRARYVGRGSSESTSSSVSRSEQVHSRASSAGDDLQPNGLNSVEEMSSEEAIADDVDDQKALATIKVENNNCPDLSIDCEHEPDIEQVVSFDAHPGEWSYEEIARNLDCCSLGRFKSFMEAEGIDGQALLLLDRVAIMEHLEEQFKTEYSPDEVNKFCRFVEIVKNNALDSTR